MNNGRALVDMRDVSISFGPVQVLNGVNFDIRAGEVHALMGENGAGKSTLMKILTGIYRADNGIVEIDGRPAEVKSPTDAQKLGIAIIHQELNLISGLTIAENIFLGREFVTRLGRIDWKKMYDEADKLLARLKVPHSSRKLVGELSIGTQQMVEIDRKSVV